MSQALPLRLEAPGGPRRWVLLGLGAGVLLAHLGLLSGGLSGLSLDMFVSPGADPVSEALHAKASPPPTASTTPDAVQEALPPPASVSRVRWILPPPPEPKPEPEPTPPPPPKAVKPPAPEPVPALRPEPEPEIALPTPAPEPLALPPADPPVALVAPEPPPPTAEPATPPSDLPSSADSAQAVAGTVQGAGLGLADPGLPPATLPPSVTLKYVATALSKGAKYNGSGVMKWDNRGDAYEARLTTRVLVFTVLEQTSAGRISAKGLSPDRFSDRRRSSEKAAHFEPASQRIRYSNNAPDAKLLPGTQDRLSINFQLSGLFNARPEAYTEGQTLRLPVSSVDSTEVWLFEVGAQTTEHLPAGDVTVRKLTRMPRKEYDRKVDVWLLPAAAFLPARIRITEPNGDYLDMALEELPTLLMPAATVN